MVARPMQLYEMMDEYERSLSLSVDRLNIRLKACRHICHVAPNASHRTIEFPDHALAFFIEYTGDQLSLKS